MQVSIETTEGLERRMTVEVPEERVTKEVQSRLQQLARTTKVKGFRPGKVPFKIVKQRFGEEVRQEVLGQVLQSSFYEAVSKESLRPAGQPTIEPKNLDEGSNIEYVATFEVFPEIEPAPISGVAFEKVTVAVTDADVDNMIDTLRKQRTEWEAVERAAADGDRVVIDFTGTIDGEEFNGNKGSNVPVTLGSGNMIPGFEEGLVGVKAGDELTLDLSFPEDYGYKDVAGKQVKFEVKVQAVEEGRLPEVNDEFAASFGIAEGGADKLREEVRANMEREVEQTLRNRLKEAVMDKLLEVNEILVPSALVDQESSALAEQMRQNMHIPEGKEGVNLDPAMFADQARRRVSLGLLISEVVKANELTVSAEQLRTQVERIAASYEHPDEVVKWYYGDKRRLSEVESLALEDRVVDWVLENADVSEVAKGFDEVMNNSKQA